jgi:hypothetical protein
MNDRDTTLDGAGPDPLASAAGATSAPDDGTPHACAEDCNHQDCHGGWFARNPRRDGLVWCCQWHGWLSPADAFDASWDAYSDLR